MEAIKNEEEVILVKKAKYEGDNKQFDTYVFNKDGKGIKLGFRQDSNNTSVIPYGISKIKVKNLSEARNSFYPKYYATFLEVVKN